MWFHYSQFRGGAEYVYGYCLYVARKQSVDPIGMLVDMTPFLLNGWSGPQHAP